MSFEKVNVINTGFKHNDYVKKIIEVLPRDKVKNFDSKGIENLLENSGYDILAMEEYVLNNASNQKNVLYLFFGLEDIIGFSEKDSFSKETSLNKNAFNIISTSSNIFFLKNKRSVLLMNKLNPYFLIQDKVNDFNWIEDNKDLKIKGLFIGKNFDISSIEIQWLKEKYKEVLIDRGFFKSKIFDEAGFKVFEFDSIELNDECFYHGLI